MSGTEAGHHRLYEAQRAKLLSAARKAFARKGRAATMADVATEAGVSHGLAYRYFASKEELLHAMVKQSIDAGPSSFRAPLESPGTPGERLTLLVSALVESRRERPASYQVV